MFSCRYEARQERSKSTTNVDAVIITLVVAVTSRVVVLCNPVCSRGHERPRRRCVVFFERASTVNDNNPPLIMYPRFIMHDHPLESVSLRSHCFFLILIQSKRGKATAMLFRFFLFIFRLTSGKLVQMNAVSQFLSHSLDQEYTQSTVTTFCVCCSVLRANHETRPRRVTWVGGGGS